MLVGVSANAAAVAPAHPFSFLLVQWTRKMRGIIASERSERLAGSSARVGFFFLLGHPLPRSSGCGADGFCGWKDGAADLSYWVYEECHTIFGAENGLGCSGAETLFFFPRNRFLYFGGVKRARVDLPRLGDDRHGGDTLGVGWIRRAESPFSERYRDLRGLRCYKRTVRAVNLLLR